MKRSDWSSCLSGSVCVSIRCTQCFLSVTIEHTNLKDAPSEEHYFWFVRFLEVVKPRDCTKFACNSVKLRWARANSDVMRGHDSEDRYSLMPLSSIVGMVSLVPAKEEKLIADLSPNRPRATTFNAHRPYYDKRYYLNHYYSHPRVPSMTVSYATLMKLLGFPAPIKRKSVSALRMPQSACAKFGRLQTMREV